MQKLVAVRLLETSPYMGEIHHLGVFQLHFYVTLIFRQVRQLNRLSRAIFQT